MKVAGIGIVTAGLVAACAVAVGQPGPACGPGRGPECQAECRAQCGPEDGADRMDGGPGRGEDPESFAMRLANSPQIAAELGLKEDQVKKLKDGLYESRMKTIDLRASLEKAAMEQARLLMEQKVDEKTLMAQIQKIGDLRTEMAKERIRPLLLVKSTLTPEQVQKAKEMLRRHREQGREAGAVEPGGFERLRERLERRGEGRERGLGRLQGECWRRAEPPKAGGEEAPKAPPPPPAE